MKILNILLLLSLYFTAQAQINYNCLDLDTSKSRQITELIVLENNSLFVNVKNLSSNNGFSTLYIISDNNEIVFRKKMGVRILGLNEIKSDTILLIGYKQLSSTESFLFSYLFDKHLNQLKVDSVFINYGFANRAKIFIKENNLSFIISFYNSINQIHYLAYNITNDYNLSNSPIDINYYGIGVPYFSAINQNNKIYILNNIIGGNIFNLSFSLLSYNSTFGLSQIFESDYTIDTIQNNLFITGNLNEGPNGQRLPSIAIADTNLNITKIETPESEFDNNSVGFVKGFCYSNPNIFLIRTLNFNSLYADSSILSIVKYNSDLTLEKELRISKEHQITAEGIYSSMENKLIFTFQNIINDTTSFISIYWIDSSLTGINSLEHNQNKNITVYPNPGKSNFNLLQDNNYLNMVIEIRDISGKIVHKQKIQNNHFSINSAKWLNGVYLWFVFGKNGLYQNGKWIKN